MNFGIVRPVGSQNWKLHMPKDAKFLIKQQIQSDILHVGNVVLKL